MSQENIKTAKALYDLMFNQCQPREAVERYVGDEYIQHNPEVGDGKEAFIEYFERMAADYPGSQRWPGDDDYAGIDIFRFDDEGKVIEHWDVLQKVPAESMNDNGMF